MELESGDSMDKEILAHIVSFFTNMFLFIDSNNEIIWISEKLLDLCKLDKFQNLKLEDFYGNLSFTDDQTVIIDASKYRINKKEIDNIDLGIISFQEVDNRKDLEDKVYAYEKIIDDLNDGVLLTNRDGKILIYNKAMEELEKRNKEDMIGRRIWNAYGYKDEDKSEHMQVFKTRKAIIDKYKAHAYNNGNPIFKSYSTIPIEKNKEIWGVYSISKNETKLRSLLSEIVDLKRQFSEMEVGHKEIRNNGSRYSFKDIVGSSERTKKVIREAQAVSWLDNSILLVGETGTGKEVFAQSIHNHGKRRSEPFIGINCSAIPENLLESILFGSVKGAYTGAVDSSGLFEEAGRGTLFLDELNSMPINMQTKLLRVLQERTVRRVGGKDIYHIKCRVVSAMNEDPYKLIEENKLRQDLFYRISGYNIYIPKLIERGEDIFELSKYYILRYNKMMNKNISDISIELQELMKSHKWPGNIRELSHFIENIMIRTDEAETMLKIENIPDYIMDVMDIKPKKSLAVVEEKKDLADKLDSMERKLILEELDRKSWNVSQTAKSLGVTRQSLIYRMKRLNIEREIGSV